MYRRTFIVYPTTLKQHSSVDSFLTENNFSAIHEAVTSALTEIGVPHTDESRFLVQLDTHDYYLKLTIAFDSEAQYETWDGHYATLVDASNADSSFFPFFEEYEESEGHHLL